MNLIKGVEVKGFRSIRDAALKDFDQMTAIVGRNSSGKSNLLRALNLFFHGEVEPGNVLRFDRDHHTVPGERKKKRISISVEFELPPTFSFRKGLENHEQTLGRHFTVQRSWELDRALLPTDQLQVYVDGAEVTDVAQLARDFLNLIHFRYIPNRTVPAALLNTESQEISRVLSSRIRRNASTRDLVATLQRAASSFIESATDALATTGAPFDNARMATPSNLGELLTVTGFEARGSHGGTVSDEDWGAGHQAFFLYQILHTVDTYYSGFFGWRQAVIWGVEEPESGLHPDLETFLAGAFRRWSRDERSRLQIVATSHSPTFTMASDIGYWVDISGGQTEFTSHSIARLTSKAQTAGVTQWIQPLLARPWAPLVLVEGDIDKKVLSHIALLAGRTNIDFVTLSGLDPAERGSGKDAIASYLRKHGGLIQNRPAEGPLLVLLDWEISDQDLRGMIAAYGTNGDQLVRRMDEANATPTLGQDFRGIERFYPADLVLASHQNGEFNMGTDEPYSVSANQLRRAKGPLLRRVLRVRRADRLPGILKELNGLQHMLELFVRTNREQPGT